jgi:anti-sigma-K factor RskA
MNYLDHRELCDRLAAEHVLGTLRGPAARRFARLAAEHATLRAMIAEWEARLSPMVEAVPERAPPSRVWHAIAARIAVLRKDRERAAAGTVPGIWASLAFWRGVGVFGSAAAVALFAVLMLRPPETVEVQVPVEVVRLLPPKSEVPPSYLAVLEDPKTRKPVLLAMGWRGSDQLIVKAVDERPIAENRSLELWTLPSGEKPRSLGLVGAYGRSLVKLASDVDKSLGGIPTLAVSLEPKGGSPTGGPTGPVLYAGPCVKLW